MDNTIQVKVKGSAKEPRIYPGKDFKPGEDVTITKNSKTSPENTLQSLITLLSRSPYKEKVHELEQEWSRYNNSPKPLDNKTVTKDMLLLQYNQLTEDPHEDNWGFGLLDIVYIAQRLQFITNDWSTRDQVIALSSILRDSATRPNERAINHTINCTKYLREQNTSLTKYIDTKIKPYQARLTNKILKGNTLIIDQSAKPTTPKNSSSLKYRGEKGGS